MATEAARDIKRRSYRHGRGGQLRFELTHTERFGEEGAEGPSRYDELLAAAAELGLAPVREGQYTVVFRCTLAESRELLAKAGAIGLSPVNERGKTINFRTTVEEHALLVEAGKRLGLSATGYAAIAALETAELELKRRRRRRRVKDYEALRKMIIELQLATNQVSRAGSLLNQAVKRYQVDGAPPQSLEWAAAQVREAVESQDRLVSELGGMLRETLH